MIDREEFINCFSCDKYGNIILLYYIYSFKYTFIKLFKSVKGDKQPLSLNLVPTWKLGDCPELPDILSCYLE